MAKKKKGLQTVMEKKPVKKIVEYYYFLKEPLQVKQLQLAVGDDYFDKADIWPELNLMEVVMDHDSLIFQDADDCFVDPDDLKDLEAMGVKKKYQISFDAADIESVREVMQRIMTAVGGVICSDTDDFQPSYTLDNLSMLQ